MAHTYRPVIFHQDYRQDAVLDRLIDDGDTEEITAYLARSDNGEDDAALARDYPTWRGPAGSRDDCELVTHGGLTYLLTINYGLTYVGLDRLLTD